MMTDKPQDNKTNRRVGMTDERMNRLNN